MDQRLILPVLYVQYMFQNELFSHFLWHAVNVSHRVDVKIETTDNFRAQESINLTPLCGDTRRVF